MNVSMAKNKLSVSILFARVSNWFSKLTGEDATCSLTLIAMIKDEIDIIDSFTLQALTLFDRVIFFDHLSSDRTSEYLASIATAYPKIEVYPLKMMGYYQSELMTWAVKTLVAPLQDHGWVFFLDADEFLPFRSRTELIEQLEPYSIYPVISMRWLNLVPDSFEDVDLETNVFRKPSHVSTFLKVAIQPKRLLNYDYVIAQGNHSVIDNGIGKAIYAKPAFCLFHIPIRCRTQIVNKIERLLGVYEARSHDRDPAHGSHYQAMLALVNQPDHTENALKFMAAHYGEEHNMEIIDAYPPDGGREPLNQTEVPFVTASSMWCEKYAITPSRVFAETDSLTASLLVDRQASVITFNQNDKTFNMQRKPSWHIRVEQ
jgi:hypothetical protein